MNYEVRFLIGGSEHMLTIEADSAAEAASLAQSESLSAEPDSNFELIQVQLLDAEHEEPAPVSPDRPQSK
jgi:hypothetical protein